MAGTPVNNAPPNERRLNFWEKLYLPEVLKGLRYSASKIGGKRYTFEYPEEQWYPPDSYRGRPVLVEEDGRPRCVACGLCARACPPLAISMQAKEVFDDIKEREPEWFEINMLRCIYCGFCEEVCPEEAIVMSKEYDLTFQSRGAEIWGQYTASHVGTAAAFVLESQTAPLSLRADSAADHRPRLHLGPVLADNSLEEAVQSGLPLRLTFRVELWREGFFDSLVDTESWTAVLMHEPLDGNYTVVARANPTEAKHAQTYAAARRELEGEQLLAIRPDRPGRYYYTARLDVETLSLSDLDELRRWLRGELRPAVSGDRSLPAALGEGIKRAFIRMLRLPARQFDARSPRFRVD
jgi:NADH-quinone oxidoreductase chain I